VLPSELARYRIIKNTYMVPIFAEINDENLFIADSIIKCYEENLNKKISNLNDSLKELEFMANSLGYDFKFIRGLKALLDRRIHLHEEDDNLAFEIRNNVFELCNKMFNGAAISKEERDFVLRHVAEKYSLPEEKVEELFLSVYEDEKIIKGFEKISAEELLKRYNLSLLQTILFKCKQLQINVEPTGHEMRLLLWSIKKLGLLYQIEKFSSRINITIDGPASIIKQTERYGTRIAKLIPLIVRLSDWFIMAYIIKKFKRQKGFEKTYVLNLSKDFSKLFPEISYEEVQYDSNLEADFAKRFATVSGEWEVIREPEPLIYGSTIFIPDFALVKGDKKVYLEIIGFWTPDYLKRKIEKIKNLKNVNIILAVDESLHDFKIEDVKDVVIVKYNKKVSSIDIIRALRRFE